jgi:uncharacterized membrane protein YfcA
VSDSPQTGSLDEWHEAASVTVTRLLCQFLLSVGTLLVALALLLTHPEYNAGIALVAGIVLGAWFGVVREPVWRARR